VRFPRIVPGQETIRDDRIWIGIVEVDKASRKRLFLVAQDSAKTAHAVKFVLIASVRICFDRAKLFCCDSRLLVKKVSHPLQLVSLGLRFAVKVTHLWPATSKLQIAVTDKLRELLGSETARFADFLQPRFPFGSDRVKSERASAKRTPALFHEGCHVSTGAAFSRHLRIVLRREVIGG